MQQHEGSGSQVIVLVEEEQRQEVGFGTVSFIPVRLEASGRVEVGERLSKRVWLSDKHGSAQEKAVVSWLSSQRFGLESGSAGSTSAGSSSPHNRTCICFNTQELKTELLGPPFRHQHTGYKYETELLESAEKEGKLVLNEIGKLEQLEYVPSSLFLFGETQAFIGSASRVDTLLFNTDSTVNLNNIHSFEQVSKKVVDSFAYSNITKRLVAVDDTVWPKFAFVFDLSSPRDPKHQFTGDLPAAINEQYLESALGGENGDILALTTTYFHRGGSGRRLVVLKVDDSTFQPLASFEEFKPWDSPTPTKPITTEPASESGSSEEESRSMSPFQGVGFLGTYIVFGAGKRGLIAIDSQGISKNSKGKTINVGGNCLSVKFQENKKAFVLVKDADNNFVIVTVGPSLEVQQRYPLSNIHPQYLA